MTPQPAPAPYVAKAQGIYRCGQILADCASPAIAQKWAAILNAHAGLVAACKYSLARFEHGPEQITNPNDAILDDLRAAIAEVPND